MSPEQQPVHRHINHFQAPRFKPAFELPEIPEQLEARINKWIEQQVLQGDPERITPEKVSALGELTFLAIHREYLDKRMDKIALQAWKRDGATWGEVGMSVGITSKGAQRRWSPAAKEAPSVKARMRKNK